MYPPVFSSIIFPILKWLLFIPEIIHIQLTTGQLPLYFTCKPWYRHGLTCRFPPVANAEGAVGAWRGGGGGMGPATRAGGVSRTHTHC